MRFAAAALLLACFVPAFARASDDALEPRAAKRVLSAGTPDERLELAQMLREHPTPDSLLIAVDGIVAAHRRYRATLKKRDAQGTKLFRFFKKHVTRYELPRDKYTEYRELEIENREIGKVLRRDWSEFTAFRDGAAEIAEGCAPMSPEYGAEIAEKLRRRWSTARGDQAKGAVIAALRGEPARALATQLHELAATSQQRDIVAAALVALSSVPDTLDLAPVGPLVDSEDPVIRRHAYRLLAARRSKGALDVMIGRVGDEVGRVDDLLVSLLRRITGQTLGDDPRAWNEWWAGARASWDRPVAAADATDFEGARTSRYFGLRLRSARVLFVLDRSWSMSEDLPGGGGTGRERRIDRAKRELISALEGLEPAASFNIVVYGTDLDRYSPRLVQASAANLAKAKRWITKLRMEGSTNLSGALLSALEDTKPSSPMRDSAVADTLVVLTDGSPNCGPISETSQILEEVKRANTDEFLRVHTVVLGNDGDTDLMEKLAKQNGGTFVHVTK